MMGVSVYDGRLFHSEVASQLMDGYSGAVEVTSATEEIAAGMMIAVSGEDKGIIYLIVPYPDGCCDCACCREERPLIFATGLNLTDYLRGMDLAKDFLGDGLQFER